MGPRAIDVLRSTKSFVHFVAECCARPCLHCHDKLGIYGAPRLWDPHRDGPGRGVLEKRSNISHLFWRRDLTRMRTSLCCGQRYLRPQNTDLTDSPPHKWGDHITHKVCWSTLHAAILHVRIRAGGRGVTRVRTHWKLAEPSYSGQSSSEPKGCVDCDRQYNEASKNFLDEPRVLHRSPKRRLTPRGLRHNPADVQSPGNAVP